MSSMLTTAPLGFDAHVMRDSVVAALMLGTNVAQCPLFARKFSNSSDTVDAVLDALHSCENPVRILQPCAAVRTEEDQ